MNGTLSNKFDNGIYPPYEKPSASAEAHAIFRDLYHYGAATHPARLHEDYRTALVMIHWATATAGGYPSFAPIDGPYNC